MSLNIPVFEVENLEKYFTQNDGIIDTLLRRDTKDVQAVDNVSFSVEKNESVAIIGESGCGKSTLLRTLMGLHEPTGGDIIYRGKRMSEFEKKDWKEYRRKVQMIFQDPFNSLDPKLTIEETLKEPLRIHNIDDKDQRVHDVLRQVELDPPEAYINRLPRNLSGGQKQRVAIARALVLEPDVLLADEPVSMLDVSTQAAVLTMLEDLIDNLGVSMIYISHDLSTVSYIAQRVKVMYLGRMVESAPTAKILSEPQHPYTKEMISAIPVPDPSHNRPRTSMSGAPQDPIDLGEGCRFRDRCPDRMDICGKTPKEVNIDQDHMATCHLYYDHDQEVSEGIITDPVDQSSKVEQ